MFTNAIEVKLYVSPSAAVRGGHAQSGEMTYTVSEDEISKLSEKELNVLSRYVGKNSQPLGCQTGAIAEPTWNEICKVVVEIISREDAADRKAEEAKKELRVKLDALAHEMELDPSVIIGDEIRQIGESYTAFGESYTASDGRIFYTGYIGRRLRVPSKSYPVRLNAIEDAYPDLWRVAKEHCASLNRELRSQSEERTRQNLATYEDKLVADAEAASELAEAKDAWVKEHGDFTLNSRYKEGYLSDTELMFRIRNEVMSGLVSIEKYKRLNSSDIDHSEGPFNPCEGDSDSVEYTVEPLTSLSSEQYFELMEVRDRMPKSATATPQIHIGRCACGGKSTRCSVRVSLDWHGRPLSRLFELSHNDHLIEDTDEEGNK